MGGMKKLTLLAKGITGKLDVPPIAFPFCLFCSTGAVIVLGLHLHRGPDLSTGITRLRPSMDVHSELKFPSVCLQRSFKIFCCLSVLLSVLLSNITE